MTAEPRESLPPEPRPVGAVVVFVVLLVGSLIAFGTLLWGFATDLVLGLLFAGLCRPFYIRLLPRVKQREWLAASSHSTSGWLRRHTAQVAGCVVITQRGRWLRRHTARVACCVATQCERQWLRHNA